MASTYFHPLYRRFLTVAALLCAAWPMLTAQTTYTIEASALYDGNNVILRWAPKDFETWNWANFHDGYDVERTTLELSGAPLTSAEMQASKVVIATGLKPLPEMQWETLPDTNMAGIVAGSIYGDSIEVVDMANADFMTVVNTNESRQNRFGFSLFACDQNFDIALAAGLGFVDTSVVEQAEYVYVIKLHTLPGGAAMKKGTTFITTVAGSLPVPLKPRASGGDKTVLISWEKQSDYGSYVLERSANNGSTYTALNNSPIVSLSTIETGKEMNTYVDSLGANNVNYAYRVRGLTPFGILGPPSDTVRAAGAPAPLATAPHISEVLEDQAGQMKLTWEFPSNMENQITQFEICRSATVDGEYIVISTAQPNSRTFTDYGPMSANYYVLKAKDLNGKYASSLPKMGQTNDTNPPAAPTGLSGSCDKNGLVTISWLPNLEGDLLGYRVYTSDQNVVDSAFAQITVNPVQDTFFQYQVDLNSLTESMFFAVKAVDFRENKSPSSAYLDINRVDVVAPSAPSITKVIPRTEAVQLDVMRSSSNDVVKYEFQKRWEGSPDWQTLASFPTAQMVTSYTDSLSYLDPVLRRRWYYYRLVAYDEAGLAVSSQMIRSKPLDQGMRGPIQNLVAMLLQGPPKRVQLTWNYNPDIDLAGFQIYRAIDNSQMRSFKFIPMTDFPSPGPLFVFVDTDTNLKGVPLQTSFVQPPPPGGGPSVNFTPPVVNQPLSQAPNAPITLKYQVMAVFYDGAQSPLSATVQVVFQ